MQWLGTKYSEQTCRHGASFKHSDISDVYVIESESGCVMISTVVGHLFLNKHFVLALHLKRFQILPTRIRPCIIYLHTLKATGPDLSNQNSYAVDGSHTRNALPRNYSQTAKTPGSISIIHRSDTFASKGQISVCNICPILKPALYKYHIIIIIILIRGSLLNGVSLGFS